MDTHWKSEKRRTRVDWSETKTRIQIRETQTGIDMCVRVCTRILCGGRGRDGRLRT